MATFKGNLFDSEIPFQRKNYGYAEVGIMHQLALDIRSSDPAVSKRDEFHNDPLQVMHDYGFDVSAWRDADGNAKIAVMVIDSEDCTISLCYEDDPKNPKKPSIYYAIIPATPWIPPEIAGDPAAVAAYMKARNWEDAWDRATTTAFGM